MNALLTVRLADNTLVPRTLGGRKLGVVDDRPGMNAGGVKPCVRFGAAVSTCQIGGHA